MKSIGSLLVGISALFAALSGLKSKRLACYCAVTSVHGFLQALLLVYIPITSQSYGFEWYVARIVQVFFAAGYTVEVLERYKPKGLALVLTLGLMFGVTGYPNVWFNWLAFVYSFAMLILGTTIVGVREVECRIVGAYWILTGCWNYAFLRVSTDPASLVWKLNWWLPSALSVSAFTLLTLKREA